MNGTEGEVRRRCAKLTLIVTLSVRVRTRNRERRELISEPKAKAI
jgi:hypothetical protein